MNESPEIKENEKSQDCWVDSTAEDNPKVSEASKDNHDNHKRNDEYQPRGRARGRHKGGNFEGREYTQKEKLKHGRAIHGRKRGGHHDHKNKAAKKYNS